MAAFVSSVRGCWLLCLALCAAEFVNLLKQGGMGALELVAMELKGAGAFVSRSLSWTVRICACVLVFVLKSNRFALLT